MHADPADLHFHRYTSFPCSSMLPSRLRKKSEKSFRHVLRSPVLHLPRNPPAPSHNPVLSTIPDPCRVCWLLPFFRYTDWKSGDRHPFFPPRYNTILLGVQTPSRPEKRHGTKIHRCLPPASCQVLPIHLSSDSAPCNAGHTDGCSRCHLYPRLHSRYTIRQTDSESPVPRYGCSAVRFHVSPRGFSPPHVPDHPDRSQHAE